MGFGTVGLGVAERLATVAHTLQGQFGEALTIEGILIRDKDKYQQSLQGTSFVSVITSDWNEFSKKCDYDLVFEAIGGLEPAYQYTEFFLEKGTPVITANKKLVAEYGETLEDLAEQRQTYYGYEAAVAGGIPIINVLRGIIPTTEIFRVSGILNGTTNYILTEMKERNLSFDEALAQAQQLGYAENDPTDDIDGFDAWYKIRILTKCCFGIWPKKEQVTREGIRYVEGWQLELAQQLGLQLKLIGTSECHQGQIKAKVEPVFLAKEESYTAVNGVTNAIQIEGPMIGELLFTGPGAGKEATANSMVEDFLFLSRFGTGNSYNTYKTKKQGEVSNGKWQPEKAERYYLAFSKAASVDIHHYLHPEAIVVHKQHGLDGDAYLVKGEFNDVTTGLEIFSIQGELTEKSWQESLVLGRLTS